MGSHHHHHHHHEESSERSSSRNHEHQGKRSHEILAGAAAFAALRAFEARQREQGKPVSHALAKELLAAFAAAEVEKLIETKGRDKWDEYRSRSRIRDEAKERSRELYRERYENEQQERHGSERDEVDEESHKHHGRRSGEIEEGPKSSSSSLRRHRERKHRDYDHSDGYYH
ncbi:hypothetical protein AA313_de0207365 [Arthrobotrys entomopaga]|nr:hypothetical protein AA313_de0207365 [Arthrobotrys entomopaga]